ncbi:MAG TPA: hypothetical protein VMZ27_13370 [Candidatus Saccharimonadales bacterium]|nr:hypothetical protein [Candidatus Saccharimonadales bacterium]
MKSLFFLIVSVAVFGTACQSQPKRSIRVAALGFRDKLKTREKFIRGESPKVILHGYGNETITILLKRNGQPVSSQVFKVPPPKVVQRDLGVQTERINGQFLVGHKTELIRVGAEIIFTLPAPPIGSYEITVQLNGVDAEVAKFSVVPGPEG